MKLKAGQIALIGVPIAVGLYLIGRQIFKKDTNQTATIPVPGKDIPDPPKKSTPSQAFPIKLGSSGANVIRLQNALKKCNSSYLPVYGVDGKWGNETERALRTELSLQLWDGKLEMDAEDLRLLEEKCNTTANTSVTNSQRIALANAQIQAFKANPLAKFYAVWKTSGNVNGNTKIWEKGDYIGFWRAAYFEVTPDGFVTATEGNNKTYFSPYGVEVKIGALYPF